MNRPLDAIHTVEARGVWIRPKCEGVGNNSDYPAGIDYRSIEW